MISDRAGPVTDAEIEGWRRHYSSRPWIAEAIRITGDITISELDARRVYEFLRAVERRDRERVVKLAVPLLHRRILTRQQMRELFKGNGNACRT